MLSRVNAEIALKISNPNSEDANEKGNRQILSIMSRLTKDFYFNPLYGPLKERNVYHI